MVDGIVWLEIFEKSVWTASGEPLARSFAKKIVFTPESYFLIFPPKNRRSDFGRFTSNLHISCFISFVLLVLMKLYNSYIVANQSVKNDKMMSAYMSEFVSFNILDKDYLAIRP